jgi:hypothetical protein
MEGTITSAGCPRGVEMVTVAAVHEAEVRTTALRKAVVDIHRQRGEPRWTVAETADVLLQVDTIFERRGICSSTRLRANRTDERFVRGWVLACEFDWLSTA